MNKLLHLISKLFYKKYFTGVVLDPRPQEEKEKDYLHEETELASTAVPYYGNSQILTAPYIEENQRQTSSCVPHGVTLSYGGAVKALTGLFKRLSKAFIYRQRSNFGQEGMWHQQAYDLMHTTGSCLFDTLPTPATEAEINAVVLTEAMKAEALKNKGYEYYRLAVPNDIDAICAVLEQGLPVSIVIFASFREWSQAYPDIKDNTNFYTAPVRHCITVLPKSGFMLNGKRYVTIQDSAWFGGINLRHLSEDFIASRVYDAIYWKKVIAPAPTDKPVHTFSIPLQYMDTGEDVKALQRVLVYEGFLPADCVTGLFAGRTRAAVKALQEKYADQILKPVGLTQGTGYVGASTLKWLNNKYST